MNKAIPYEGDNAFRANARDGKPVTKTFDGDTVAIVEQVKVPPVLEEIKAKQ